MKKAIATLLASAMLMLLLTACVALTPAEPPEQTSNLERIAELAAKSYSSITLDVTTVTDGVRLSASYTLTQDRVSYSIEKLNTVPTDGTAAGLSPSYKTTLTGEAVIENGVLKTLDGEAVDLPSYDELRGGFRFDESNFSGVVDAASSYKANIARPSDFFGASVEMIDPKITVKYTAEALSEIKITYRTDRASVETLYTFVK